MFIVKNSKAVATALTVFGAPGLAYSGTQLYTELRAYQKNHFDPNGFQIDLTGLKFQDKNTTKVKTAKKQPKNKNQKNETGSPFNGNTILELIKSATGIGI